MKQNSKKINVLKVEPDQGLVVVNETQTQVQFVAI